MTAAAGARCALAALPAGLLAVVLAACESPSARPSPDAAPAAATPAAPTRAAAALLADSAAGDDAALASLPPRLAAEFAVAAYLTADSLRDTARVSCRHLDAPAEPEERRRMRAVRPDSSRTVLFVRAARATGELRRVELVRRRADGTQRGFTWTADGDSARTLEWARGSNVPEVGDLPRGGPVPRALRALGRRLLVLPCGEKRP